MATVNADTMKNQAADAKQFNTAYTQRQQASQGVINSTVDDTLNTQKTGLLNAYNQNVIAQDEAQTKSNQAYETAKADLGVQADRTQRGMDSFADARNLNRQEGSQQAIQLGRASQTSAGKISALQNQAMDDMAKRQQLLTTSYQNQVRQAIVDNDYRRAAALFDDYNNQNSWLEKNAALMANMGNFSGYEQLYGAGTAGGMRDLWIAQNPEAAYNTGVIDGARYEQITGKKPPDYVEPVTNNGGGGFDWWQTVQGQMALGKDYGTAYANASGKGGSSSSSSSGTSGSSKSSLMHIHT